jgi:hypothetical protein
MSRRRCETWEPVLDPEGAKSVVPQYRATPFYTLQLRQREELTSRRAA